MGLNTPLSPQSDWNAPRGLLEINDQPNAGVISWSVVVNSYLEANKISVELSLEAQPKGFGLDYWSKLEKADVKAYLGYPEDPDKYSKNELDLIFTGELDRFRISPVTGKITGDGRDYTARFIESVTTEKFQSLTSSQLVEQFARRQGMTPVVVPTTETIGTLYSTEKVLLNTERSEWDLMTFLAQQEDYLLYVEKEELHFKPKPDDNAPESDIYEIKWVPKQDQHLGGEFEHKESQEWSNAKTFEFERSFTLAKDIEVVIRSGNQGKKRAIAVTRKASNSSRSSGGTQRYVRWIPGLTREEATREAGRLLKQITDQEILFTATLPADNLITPATPIRFVGSGTAFDQIYFVDTLTKTFSVSKGFEMTLRAKNHATGSEVVG